MPDDLNPPGPPKPSPEELEARWQRMMQEVADRPRDLDVLIRAGTLAEEMNRKAEAYIYFQKAIALDPSQTFLVARLRKLASTPEQQKEVQELARRPASFSRALDGVFTYPFKGAGIGILIVGAVFFYIVRLIAYFNIIPFISLLVLAIVSAYLAMFYMDVLHTTVAGESELPGWPDPTHSNEFFLDWLKILAAPVAAFLPVLLLGVLFFYYAVKSSSERVEEESASAQQKRFEEILRQLREQQGLPAEVEEGAETEPRPEGAPRAPAAAPPPRPGPSAAFLAAFLGAGGIFTLLGIVYLPMGLLANCIYGHPFACFQVPFVLRSIGTARKDYAVCVLVYFAVALAIGAVEFLARLPGIMFFSGALGTLVELYGAVVGMRILGLFYRMNQARLGWLAG